MLQGSPYSCALNPIDIRGPEFTGNSNGELWGFFPQTNPPSVSQIDKVSGAVIQSYPLTDLSSNANAWAFAFWGGDFYIFLQ